MRATSRKGLGGGVLTVYIDVHVNFPWHTCARSAWPSIAMGNHKSKENPEEFHTLFVEQIGGFAFAKMPFFLERSQALARQDV